jgi:hypothetical protein
MKTQDLQAWFRSRKRINNNVFIGNVGNVISSASILASNLVPNDVANISDFRVDDENNVLFTMSVNYGLRAGDFPSKSTLSHFIDLQGRFTAGIGSDSLRNAFRLKMLYLPNCGTDANSVVATNAFKASPAPDAIFYIPKATRFGSRNENVSFGKLFLNPIWDGSTDATYLKLKERADNNVNSEIIFVQNFNLPNTINTNSFSIDTLGGTYFSSSWDFPAPAAPSNNALQFTEIWKDGVWLRTIEGTSLAVFLLIPETNYLFKLYAADIYYNRSTPITVSVRTPAIDIAALAVDAVANYPFDETTGDAIDTINGEDGTLSGSISRDGEYYTYGGANAIVTVPNNANLNFVDGNGVNVDFTIKTEFIATAFNSLDRFWLVTKIDSFAPIVADYQLIYVGGAFIFGIWSDQNVRLFFNYVTPLVFNEKYIVGISCIGSNLFMYVNGVQVATVALPNNFTFSSNTSNLEMGNTLAANVTNLIGKQKRTVILKGRGWTQEDWSDAYNGGNGIDI